MLRNCKFSEDLKVKISKRKNNNNKATKKWQLSSGNKIRSYKHGTVYFQMYRKMSKFRVCEFQLRAIFCRAYCADTLNLLYKWCRQCVGRLKRRQYLAYVALRFCREQYWHYWAAKPREKYLKTFSLPPPQSPRGFSAVAQVYSRLSLNGHLCKTDT